MRAVSKFSQRAAPFGAGCQPLVGVHHLRPAPRLNVTVGVNRGDSIHAVAVDRDGLGVGVHTVPVLGGEPHGLARGPGVGEGLFAKGGRGEFGHD
jgi:hypothetical protein